jgi:ferric-dicitrate binding protein FerR (iron transport regulator)
LNANTALLQIRLASAARQVGLERGLALRLVAPAHKRPLASVTRLSAA